MYRASAFAALLLTACQDLESPEQTKFAAGARSVTSALQAYVVADEESILLTNLTIITGDGETILQEQWLRISGDEIEAIGSMSNMPSHDGVRVLDLSGHTVLPGLIGMHNHLHMPGNPLLNYSAPRLYLASGVTTIATAGSADPIGEASLARRISAGEEPGPTIVLSAPYVTGIGGNPPMDKPKNREEVETFIDAWTGRGVKWFKVYRHTEPNIAKILVETAHAKGAKVTGHLCSITYSEAALMGFDSLEHGISAAADFVVDRKQGECVPTWKSLIETGLNSEAMDELITILVENDVTITSTLAILETSFAHRPQGDARSLAALSPSRVDAYMARQIRLAENAEASAATPELWDMFTGFERRFVAAGGRLVAGPDTGRHVLPGYGDQRNFELLVEAGFSVAQVVRIMTSNGAETLGIEDEVGSIAPGLKADLVVVRGDLVVDPVSIRDVRYVFKDGLGFDPTPLIAEVQGQIGNR